MDKNIIFFSLRIILIICLSINHLATASLLTEDDLDKAISSIKKGQKSKTHRLGQLSIQKLDDYMIEKISEKIFKVINITQEKDNSIFQTALSELRIKSEHLFLKKLPEYGQANRTDEQNKKHFIKLWIDSINKIFEIHIDSNKPHKLNSDMLCFSDEEEDDVKTEEHLETVKTTLFNMLLRQDSSFDHAKKIQTLIENGANKNLHEELTLSSKMENQKEYPLYIILCEIEDSEKRKTILDILLNDSIVFEQYNKEEKEKDNRLSPVLISLNPNKIFILNKLIEKEDFPTFNIVMNYLEQSFSFITEVYSDKSSQINEQIYCPILEKIMTKMSIIRKSSLSSDENGFTIDNLHEFFSAKILKTQVSINHDARFSLHFQNRLTKDYEKLFKNIAQKIDSTRSESEIKGDELKAQVLEWTKWANFRNRICKHLNKFALSASNEGNKSNVIKLIRYANIYNNEGATNEEEEVFKELHMLGGTDIIFTTRNKFKWTPLMYAMFQKQSEGIQLYLRQAPHEITTTDGVDNNILHLAFPLPESLFKQEGEIEEDNILELVGADVGVQGAKEKTFEAIRAIITERSINVEDKITALCQLSAANFTPVSLAAATGYIEIYDFLIAFLKANSAWNEDDHAHLGIRVSELIVGGLKNYKISCERNENLSSNENNMISSEIEKRQSQLSSEHKNCIREIYHIESRYAEKLLDEIRKPANKIMKEFYNTKGTKQRIAPYSQALEASIEAILHPEEKIEFIELPPSPIFIPTVDSPKKKSSWKKIFSKNKKKQSKVEEPPVVEKKPKTQKIVTPSILEGMRGSTSAVKASYLGQVVREITESYLKDHISPQKMSFAAVYKGMTGYEMQEFFLRKFNQTVEKKMQKIIIGTMEKSGRLRLSDNDGKTNSRFDELDDEYINSSVSDEFSEEETTSVSDEDLDD